MLVNMRILGIETANGCCSVCIGEQGGQLLAHDREENAAMQAERLLPMIEDALASAELNYSDIEALAVTIGPGSFTGVRIGLAAARGIALAARMPMIGISTLELAAYTSRKHANRKGELAVMLDARRGQCYAQGFLLDDAGVPQAKEEPKLITLEEVRGHLKRLGIDVVTSNNVSLLSEWSEAIVAPVTLDAAPLVTLAQHKSPIAERTSIRPLYIRPPDAKLPKNAVIGG